MIKISENLDFGVDPMCEPMRACIKREAFHNLQSKDIKAVRGSAEEAEEEEEEEVEEEELLLVVLKRLSEKDSLSWNSIWEMLERSTMKGDCLLREMELFLCSWSSFLTRF